MAGIIGNLISASQSLTTQTQGVEIASKNIANINTPGYARQRLVLGDKGMIETPLGLQSMGVQALGIEQIRNTFLDSQVIREISKTSSLDAQESALSQAQANLGEPIEGTTGAIDVNTATTSSTGISAAINKFFNAFENFAAKPTDSGAKQQVLQQADAFVNRVNLTDNRLDSLQTDLTKQVSTELKSANDLISQIASLNGQIQTVEISVPNSAVDLRTKRQATLEELAKFVDFKATEVPGQYGQMLVTSQDASGNPVTLVSKTAASSITFSGTQFSVGSTVLDLQGGSLQGSITARDGVIQTLRDSLKTLADQTVSSVNGAYNPSGTGQNIFATGALSSGIMKVDPGLTMATLKPSLTGNVASNDSALAVANLSSKKFSTAGGDLINVTLREYYAQEAGGFGQSLSSVKASGSDQKTVEDLIRTQRDSVSGVSENEELTDLMKFQRGFQASARVVNVLDNLLDVIINGLGSGR